MENSHKKLIGIITGVLLLTAGTAAVASYVIQEPSQSKTQPHAQNAQPHNQKVAEAQPAQPDCDDSNIVGTIAGGAAGGIAGSQIGKGSGKTAATIGGVIGGAYLGNQYIPTKNATCR